MPAALLRRLLRKTVAVTKRAVLEFIDDRGHRDAAQIAFFAVLSAVPLAMLLVGGLGLAFDDAEVRERTVEVVFDNVPLAQSADREQTEDAVRSALDNTGELGPISIVLLLVAATGVMGALRHSINQAWDIEQRPSILKRKALDLALVLGATVLVRLHADARGDAARRGAARRRGGRRLARVDRARRARRHAAVRLHRRGDPLPLPRSCRGRGRRCARSGRARWSPPRSSALAREALDAYFEHLADFGALYGSLGALMALLLFVYAVANVLVFGAEFASEWSRFNDVERP